MLHDRLPIGSGRKRHRDHVDPHALVLKAMPADIDGSQFGDPPLLCRPDRLGRVAMLGFAAAIAGELLTGKGMVGQLAAMLRWYLG